MTIYEEYERKEIDWLGNILASVKPGGRELWPAPQSHQSIRHRGRGGRLVYVLAVRV